jgi:phosphate uptake regulator
MSQKDPSRHKIETRRLQKTGGSSYVITLPKEWLKDLQRYNRDLIEDKIDPNSADDDPFRKMKLGVITQPDNTLLITPHIDGRKIGRNKLVRLEKIQDSTFLYRYLISTYIAGFTDIRIESATGISLQFIKVIREFLGMVIGLVIIEEKEEYILIKDVLDPREMPYINIIQRQVTTTKNMVKETLNALKNFDENCKEIIEEVFLTDNEVDRLYWLSTRLTNMILRDIQLSDITGIPADLAANYFLVSRHIERIADHVVRIAENVAKLEGQEIKPGIIEEIERAINNAFDVFETSIDALLTKNIEQANSAIETVKDFEVKIDEVLTLISSSKESMMAISLDNIVESIRRIGEYSRDISENVMNYLVWEE